MKNLRRERDAEFAAAPNRQGTGTALVLVNDKLTRRNAEFGTPKYKSSRIAMREPTAAHKGICFEFAPAPVLTVEPFTYFLLVIEE